MLWIVYRHQRSPIVVEGDAVSITDHGDLVVEGNPTPGQSRLRLLTSIAAGYWTELQVPPDIAPKDRVKLEAWLEDGMRPVVYEPRKTEFRPDPLGHAGLWPPARRVGEY